MKQLLLATTLWIFFVTGSFAQSPGILWAQTFGGPNNDDAYGVIKTSDGGYAICGMTESKGKGGKDAWVIKLDPQGKLEWDKTYGDKGDDVAHAIIQTSDNGYAFVGYTTSKGKGKSDLWFVKLDSAGNQLWEGVYGGSKHDQGNSLVQTYDGNYVVAGSTKSFGAGNWDVWAMKIDTKGQRIWRKTEGGKSADQGSTVVEDPRDSSLVIAGSTGSYGSGQSNLWLIKLTKEGKREWRKHYGTINREQANHLTIKSTGEFIMAGAAQPKGERYQYFWVVGFTPESWDDWEVTYGTTKDDAATCSAETTDGGVMVCGYTSSYGEGGYDFWLMKFDKDGKQLWQETFGGLSDDQAYAMVATGPNEGVIVGTTMSDGEGKRDVWVIAVK